VFCSLGFFSLFVVCNKCWKNKARADYGYYGWDCCFSQRLTCILQSESCLIGLDRMFALCILISSAIIDLLCDNSFLSFYTVEWVFLKIFSGGKCFVSWMFLWFELSVFSTFGAICFACCFCPWICNDWKILFFSYCGICFLFCKRVHYLFSAFVNDFVNILFSKGLGFRFANIWSYCLFFIFYFWDIFCSVCDIISYEKLFEFDICFMFLNLLLLNI
jgi:hypothetical protein